MAEPKVTALNTIPIDQATENEGSTSHHIPESETVESAKGRYEKVPVSLTRRAPVGPVPTTIFRMYLQLWSNRVEFAEQVEQKNACIRSKLTHKSRDFELYMKYKVRQTEFKISYTSNKKSTILPYPSSFAERINLGRDTARESKRSAEGDASGGTGVTPGEPDFGRSQTRARTLHVKKSWGWGVTIPCPWNWRKPFIGISKTTEIEYEQRNPPAYVVIGIFLKGQLNPEESIIVVHDGKDLFTKLGRGIFRLRGFGSSCFSLRSVRGFRIYQCDHEKGTHRRVNLDDNGVSDVQLLFETYRRWHVPEHITLAWADWIHHTLNNGSQDVRKGGLSLELVLDWSAPRISVVVLLPVLLSLGIGLWLNASNWTDLATIQTAWGTASYIVTASGLLTALLGIFSSLASK